MPSYAYHISEGGERLQRILSEGIRPVDGCGQPMSTILFTRWKSLENAVWEWCMDAPLDMPIAIIAVDAEGLQLKDTPFAQQTTSDEAIPPSGIRVLTEDARTMSDWSSLRPVDDEDEAPAPKRASSPGF